MERVTATGNALPPPYSGLLWKAYAMPPPYRRSCGAQGTQETLRNPNILLHGSPGTLCLPHTLTLLSYAYAIRTGGLSRGIGIRDPEKYFH